MIPIHSSPVSKKLALKFILENIDCRKRSLYLQEIILLGRENELWVQVLSSFLNKPLTRFSIDTFSKN